MRTALILLLALWSGAGCRFQRTQLEDSPVRLDELVKNYKSYEGQVVIVVGTVLAGEGEVMVLPPISASLQKELMAVRMKPELVEGGGPLEREYVERIRAKGYANATIEGTFRGRETRSFGHQSCCRFELDVVRVLDVE